MVENQTSALDLEDKANNIKNTAFEVQSNARALETEARKRNCRLWALIIIIGIAILLYIIIPLATSSDEE